MDNSIKNGSLYRGSDEGELLLLLILSPLIMKLCPFPANGQPQHEGEAAMSGGSRGFRGQPAGVWLQQMPYSQWYSGNF